MSPVFDDPDVDCDITDIYDDDGSGKAIKAEHARRAKKRIPRFQSSKDVTGDCGDNDKKSSRRVIDEDNDNPDQN